MSSQLTNVRYGYFDALRGLTMILVVLSHVFLFSLDICPTINIFCCTFRMPLFFFVSGFFAYKVLGDWNRERIRDIITRKFKVQIVGALFFSIICSIVRYGRFPEFRPIFYAENEYWFTFILFRLFLIYMVIVMIARQKPNGNLFWKVIIGFSICCVIFNLWDPRLPRAINNIVGFIVPRTFYYFPYFALGLAARSLPRKFEKILANDSVKVGLMLFIVGIWCVILLGFLPQVPMTISFGYQAPLAYPLGVCTLLLIVQFFYANRFNIERNTAVNRSLKFIGRRTLDIYFLHYFFLPDLKIFSPYFQNYDSLSAQLTAGIAVSLIVVAFSLLVGQVIRMSPILAEWLLGVKRRRL